MYVKVYDKSFRLNKKTRKNFDKVLTKTEPLVNKLAYEFFGFFNYIDIEDLKQDIREIIFNGILTYKSDKRTKLSSFLHVHTRNKLISLAEMYNAEKRSAIFIDKDFLDNNYASAERSLDFLKDRYLKEQIKLDDLLSDAYGFNSDYQTNLKTMRFNIAFRQIIEKHQKQFPDEMLVLEKIYYQDKSIVDMGKEIGLSGWATKLRIRKVAHLFKDLLIEDLSYDSKPPAKNHVERVFYKA